MHKALNLMLVLMFLTTPLTAVVGTVGPSYQITAQPVNVPLNVLSSRGEGAPPTGSVDVTVENTLNIARTKEVVRLSVPLGNDELRDLNKIKVVNNVTQQEVLSGVLPSTVQYYPNGSIRRMDVTWQDDFTATQVKHYKIVIGTASDLFATNMTVTQTSTGATVKDGSKTYTIGGDASGQNPAYVRCANSKGEAQAYFLVQMGGNQFTNDQVSYTILWGRPTLIETDANEVMATVHLKYDKPTVVLWNGPSKSDIDLVSADVVINFYNDRNMVEFKETKSINERYINHNGFVAEFTALLAGEDEYTIEFGNSDHTTMTANTKSYTIAEDTKIFKNITSSWRSAPAFADWDSDGDYDLVVGDENGTLTGYKNIGNKTVANFTSDATVFTGIDAGTYSVPDFGDLNGDGLMDMIIGKGDGSLDLYLNTGSTTVPSWTIETTVLSGIDVGSYSAPGLADLDGDGDLDLAIGEKMGGITYYQNTGSTTVPTFTINTTAFQYMNTPPTRKPETYSDPDFADVDWDGDLDFISGVEKAFWMGIVFYFNTGNNKLAKFTDIHNQWYDIVRMYEDKGNFTHTEWVDLNDDKNPDLVVGRMDGTLKYYYFVGNTTPERKGCNMVPLENGSYRYFYDLGRNEGQYEVIKEDTVWNDYYLINGPKTQRTVMRYLPDFKRLAYSDPYYTDAYPWAGGNVSWYPDLPGEHGLLSRGGITFGPFAGGANSATFYTQTGMGNGFVMSGPTGALDFTSREVLLDDLPFGQPASYYDNWSKILATPLKVSSPIDLTSDGRTIRLEPNKVDGQTAALSAVIEDLGGNPGTNIKFEFFADEDLTLSLCSGTVSTVPGLGKANATCQWDTTGWGGDRRIFLWIDNTNLTKELDEANNIVNGTLTVPFTTVALSPIYKVSNNVGNNNSMAIDMVVDSNGKPWATWLTYQGEEDWDVGVSSFDGTAFKDVTWINKGQLYSADPAITADANGKLWLSFGNNIREHEKYVSGRHAREYWNTRQDLYIAKYDGTSWAAPSRLTNAFVFNDTDQASDIVVLNNGTVWLTYRNTKFELYCTPGFQIDNQPYSDLNILARNYNPTTSTWSGNVTIDNSPGEQGWWNGPTISTANGQTWFIWDSEIAGKWTIQSKKYSASGFTSMLPVPLPANGNGMRPTIAAKPDGTAWAVYESKVDQNTSIYASYYDGTKWSDPTMVSEPVGREIKAAVVVDSLGNPWVAWESDRDGNKNIYMRHFNGLYWSDFIQVTTDPAPDEEPTLAIGPGNTIWVGWESDANGHGHRMVYARKLTYTTVVPSITGISSDPATIYEDDVVTFTGTAAATGGKIARFEWDLNNDGSYEIVSSKGQSVEWSYPQKGTFQVRLRVTSDSDLAVQSSLFVVEVLNKLPVAIAGPDRFVAEDTIVTFNGSASYDTPTDMAMGLEYKWDFGDGNTTPSWSHNPLSTHVYTSFGFFTVKLYVRDSNLAVANDTLNITVYNLKPIVNITIGNLTGEEDQTLTFSGSGNDTKSDDGTLVWRWDFGDGTHTDWSRTISVQHAYADQGLYKAQFFVMDKDEMTSNGSVYVNITNLPPTVFETTYPDSDINEDELVNFTGSGDDTPSDVLAGLKYYWDFGDGTNTGWINVTETSHTYNTSGKKTVKFKVRDNNGAENSRELPITVVDPAPWAFIDTNVPKKVDEDASINFTGYATDTVSDEDNLSLVWDFGDGTTANGTSVNHTYPQAKQFVVTLTATDDEGEVGNAQIIVTVMNLKPTAKATADKTSVKVKETVTFSSAGSTDTPSDVPLLKYLWSFGDGTQSTKANPTHEFTSGGDKRVTLTVTDNDGETATMAITIKVTGKDNGDGGDGGLSTMMIAGLVGAIIAVVVVIFLFLMLRKKGQGPAPKPKPKAKAKRATDEDEEVAEEKDEESEDAEEEEAEPSKKPAKASAAATAMTNDEEEE